MRDGAIKGETLNSRAKVNGRKKCIYVTDKSDDNPNGLIIQVDESSSTPIILSVAGIRSRITRPIS